MDDPESPSIRGKNRALYLFGALCVCAGLWKLFSVYVQPLIDRGRIKKARTAVFDRLTKESGLSGKVAGDGEVFEVDFSFLPDESNALLDPSDPSFHSHKYKFALTKIRAYSPQVPTEECRVRKVAVGEFPRADKAGLISKEDSIRFNVSWDGGSCILSRDPTNPQKVKIDKWSDLSNAGSLTICSSKEWNDLNAARDRAFRAAKMDRTAHNLSTLLSWWASISRGEEFSGTAELTKKHLFGQAGASSEPVRLSVLAGEEFRLRIAGAERSFSGKYKPEQEPPKVVFAEKGGAGQITVPVTETSKGNFSGDFVEPINDKPVERKIALRAMTKEEVTAERDRADQKMRVAQSRIEARRKGIYLLNRSLGLQARWRIGGSDSFGVFRAVPTTQSVERLADADTHTLRYELSFTQYGTEVYYFEGSWTDLDTPNEAIVLKKVRGGQNEKWDEIEIRFSRIDLTRKTVSGVWSGKLSIDPGDVVLDGIARMLFGGPSAPSAPRGRGRSGELELIGNGAGRDDYLLEFNEKVAPRAIPVQK